MIKNAKLKVKLKDCEGFLKYTNAEDDLKEYKCLFCYKNYQREFDENLKKRFGTYKFPNHDTNKFILLLQKGVYPYEYMDDWEKFNEISLSEKEDFYSYLKMEDIIDAYYAHTKRFCKELKIRNLGNYHGLYVQSNTLLLADLFENFWKMCCKIYELDPAHFLSAPGLAWQTALNQTR